VLNSDYPGQICSIARALEVVGERWTLLVVRELLRRPRRFSDLERALGISKNVLTARLGRLVAEGIVVTEPSAARRDWHVYRLTSKGTDLFPVIASLMAWGDAHAAPHGAPAVFEHSCGHPAGFRVVCEACDGPVDAAAVRPVAGPGFRAG
jgi:DNA-binding HxlR family transcriptional regulator